MEKILFIVPPNITYEEFVAPPQNVKQTAKQSGRIFGSVITDIPLGPISLSAYLKRHAAVETRLIDFNVELNRIEHFDHTSFRSYYEDFFAAIIGFAPTIVGISALFAPSYRSFIDLAEVSRKTFPDALLLGGGNLPTAAYRGIMQDTRAFDAICYGEGERPMLRLLQAKGGGGAKIHLEASPNWITHDKLEQHLEFGYDFIEDLDDIPRMDYEILDVAGYDINPTMYYYTSERERQRGMAIMTSRGCPFKCIFCASHKAHGRSMRYHSVDRIVDDAQRLKDDYGARTIIILDDHFMGDRQRAYQIVDRLSRAGHELFFPNALALYALDRPFLELLRRAGTKQLILAVESGSERVLKQVMKKPLKLDIVRRVVNDCRELGIYTDCNILVGLPGETKADIAEAREFLKTINADWFRINVATPLVGSEMYEICNERNYFKDTPILGNYKKAIVETEDFSAAYIQETSYLMNIELNFVHNANMKLGRFAAALDSFRNVLKAKHDHPIAHYCASLCYDRLGDKNEAARSMLLARRFASGDAFWRNIIERFSLPLPDTSSSSIDATMSISL